MADLADVYRELVEAAKVGEFEANLMATPLAREAVHNHPLGFKVVRLSESDISLRLHLWAGPQTEQLGFEVHSHSFDFESYVVEGVLQHSTYLAEREEAGAHAIYGVSYEEGRSLLKRSSVRVRLSEISRAEFASGKSYRVRAQQLHAAARVSPTAISLVLTRESGRSAETIGPWDGPAQLETTRSEIDPRPLAVLGLNAALALSA